MVFTGSLWSSRPTVGSPNAPARQEKSEPAPPSKRNGFQLFLSSVWGGVVSNVFLLLFPSFSFPGSVCSVLLPLCLLCSKQAEEKRNRQGRRATSRTAFGASCPGGGCRLQCFPFCCSLPFLFLAPSALFCCPLVSCVQKRAKEKRNRQGRRGTCRWVCRPPPQGKRSQSKPPE